MPALAVQDSVSRVRLTTLITAQRPLNGSKIFNWWRPGLIQLLLGFFALVASGQVEAGGWWILGVFLVVSGLALLPYLYRAMKRPATVVLADHLFVLAGAFFAYYVVGALLLPFGPIEQVEYSLSYYRLDASMAFRVAAVNSIGFGLALIAGVFAPKRLFARLGRSAVRVGYRIPLEWVIAGFLLLGSWAYIHVLSFDLGQQSDAVISGSWRTMSKLLLAAVVLAAAHQGRGARVLRFAAVLMVVVQAVGGLLMLNKSEVLMPMMALLVGYAWRYGVRRIAVPGVLILLTTFLVIGSPVGTVRNLYSPGTQVDWGERVSLLWSGVFNPRPDTVESEYHSWARFCYTPPQAAAIDFFDHGRGGDDFGKLAWAFLPRVLFPGKPVITASSAEFHYKISGGLTSSTGYGVFADGYYNLGWLGVMVSGLGVGLMLACTASFAREVFRSRALVCLPFALMGSYMAFRIDGTFLADYLGPFALLLYIFVGVVVTAQFMKNRERPV